MDDIPSASRSNNTFCLGCGYPLRQLAANRCPECGRAFDPANPRTMSIRRPLRKWQRWLLKPIGWPIIALVVTGAVGMAYLSRWPRWTPAPWPVLREEFRWPAPALRPFTLPDKIFYTAAACLTAFVALFMVRFMARFFVPRNARRAPMPGNYIRLRRAMIATAMLVTLCCVVFGWRQRIGQRWMARLIAANSSSQHPPGWIGWWMYDLRPSIHVPLALSREQARAVLTAGAVDLPAREQRLAALALLIESDGKAALPTLLRVAAREDDAAWLAWELRLIGLCRDPATAPLLIAHLKDSRPGVRAAAADAVGILRHPSYSVHLNDPFWIVNPLSLDSDPPIILEAVVLPAALIGRRHAEHDLLDDPPISIDVSVRMTLERMMIDGATSEEREAAARTLVAWPPEGLQFRVAEWGVWVGRNGHLALAQSIVDEIPPFVHQTGNPLSEFDSYFRYPSVVTKPIVHLTANLPLAADVEVHIRDGRPWFAYPRPDDFGIGNEAGKVQTVDVGPRSPWIAKPLSDCREGYPWLSPHHRVYSSRGTTMGGPAMIYNLGVRWMRSSSGGRRCAMCRAVG